VVGIRVAACPRVRGRRHHPVGGKRIDTGPIAASASAGLPQGSAGTASAIDAAMTKVATAVKNAFKGVKTTLDNRLLAQIGKTSKQPGRPGEAARRHRRADHGSQPARR
jgi:hypothetical protein